MGVVFRQSVKTSVVVIAGAFLGALTIWLSTKFINQQQYGSIGNLTNNAVTISQVVLFGLSNTMAVYIHRFANDDRKKKLLLTITLMLPLLFSAIGTLIYYFLRTWLLKHYQPADEPFMDRYFLWLPVYTIFFIYMTVLEQYLGSQMKVAVSAFMREVILRLANIILILLYAFGYVSFNFLVLGSILIYLIPISIFLFLAINTKGFGFNFKIGDFTSAEYKEMIHFSWYHFLLTISISLIYTMDSLMLPFYDHRGFITIAIYRVAIFLISFLQLPFKAMTSATFPVLAKAFADDDHPKAKNIFIRSSLNILIPTVVISLMICCNLRNVVDIIKNGYDEVTPVFLILFLGGFVNIITGMNDSVLSIANLYKINFYLSLVLIIVLFILLRIFIPRYGIYGAAWSTTTTLILFNIAKCFFVWKKLDMQPFSRNTLLVILAAIPALAAGFYFPYLFNPEHHIYIHTFIDTTIRSIIILIIYLLMLLWLKPSADLEEYLASIKKNRKFF